LIAPQNITESQMTIMTLKLKTYRVT